MGDKKISVMIVDDHPLFRQGLRRVIEVEDDMEVIIEVGDGEEALRLAQKMVPDVIMMDVNIPTMNGLQVTRRLKAKLPNIGVIMLTAYHDDEQIFHAIKAGAGAYYPKDVTPRKLIEAIRQVSEGNYVIDDNVLAKSQVASWLLKQFEQMSTFGGSPEDLFVPLSPREMEILQLIARGYSNKEIAHELGISRQTVKNHMTSILRKLSVNDRTQAALYALRRGWIRLQDTD
ncbi:MAG: response regulator transcription factor [Anaerolineales bacterium]|nr:MAG: response regulator transcription factor [Anaerolineales bacterium]